MTGTIVHATSLDSIRIEILGEGRAITLPAKLVLAADHVLRNLCMDTDAELTVRVKQSPNDGPRQWCARLHGREGWSVTPWGAVCELAAKLEVDV